MGSRRNCKYDIYISIFFSDQLYLYTESWPRNRRRTVELFEMNMSIFQDFAQIPNRP